MRRFLDANTLKRWMSLLALVAAAIVIYHVAAEFSLIFAWIGGFFHAIAPFIWGFMLAYALNIPREHFEDLLHKIHNPFVSKYKRALSIVMTYVALAAVVALVLNIIVPRIYESIVDFVAFLPTLMATIEDFFVSLDESDAVPFIDFTAIAAAFSIDDLLADIDFGNITAAIGTVLGLTGTVFRVALAIISSVYFLVEGDRVKDFAVRILRASLSTKIFTAVVKYGREINAYFKRYIFCQVLDAVILGTIMTIAMSVMGVGYAFVLGPMLGFANLIPYFGSIFGTIAAIVVIMITDGMQMGLIATIVLIILQQIDANYIFPRLLGGQMKIPPLMVIIGITIGNALYGIIGMIFAIPVVTVLRNIVVDVLEYVEAKKIEASNAPDNTKEE